MKPVILLLISCALFCTAATAAWYDNAQWYDTFYQYRIPVEAAPTSGGMQVLNVSSDQIVAVVNSIEEFHVSDWMFDFNNVKVVEYDDTGGIVNVIDTAGYYLSFTGPNVIYNGDFEVNSGAAPAGWTNSIAGVFTVVSGMSHDGSNCLKITSDVMDRNRITQSSFAVAADTYYLLSWWSKRAANTYGVAVGLTDVLDSWNKSVNYKSYTPSLKSKYWTQYEIMFHEDSPINIQANIERTLTGTDYIDDVSIKQARIDLLLDVDAPGPKKYMIYYQPTQSDFSVVPEKRIGAAPATTITPSFIGGAQKYESKVKYSVVQDPDYDIWFAETVQKITPAMAPPSLSKPVVSIKSAINEKQSFQLVVKAKNNMTIDTAALGNLTSGAGTIGADKSYVKILSYVSMTRKSPNAHNFVPRVGDMLEAFAAQNLSAASENLALWFTVAVDTGVGPGLYSGNVEISGTVGGSPFTKSIPVELTVHQFAIPERVAFRTSHGGQHFAIRYSGSNSVFDFHGATTTGDQAAVVRGYYDEMCANRVYPFFVTYGQGYTYSWNPPAQYGVDAPGNFFYLYDFDFTDYNANLAYYMDTYKVNSVGIGHTNGDQITRFTLSGNFRVAWDNPGTGFTDITMLQFDNLILDYWREVAINLIINGWIDHVYYSIDESSIASYPHVRHVLEVLQSDYFTAQIPIQWDIDKVTPYGWKEYPDTQTEPSFKGLVDIWTPENNDGYNFYEDYYFTDNNMDPAVEENWCYYTESAHLIIDTQGINNRTLPMKNFFMNSNGFLMWGSAIYEGLGMINPRIDPWTSHGNGNVAYFYPPQDTPCTTPNFTVTPSCRLETFREGIEDYEYMLILSDWIDTASANGVDTTTAVSLINQMHDMFQTPVRYSTNDEHYLWLIDSIAGAIDNFISPQSPVAEITDIVFNGGNVTVTINAVDGYQYDLLRTFDITQSSGWVVVDSAVAVGAGPINLTDNSLGGAGNAFYLVQTTLP